MKTLMMLAAVAAIGAQAQTWRFTCDYVYLDTKGHISHRDRVSGLYTRGPDGAARWNGVTVATAPGEAGDFGPARKREFMEGFSYPHSTREDLLGAGFFQGFPPMAMQERNLVWDTDMLEGFAAKLAELKPDAAYHVPGVADIPLAGMGSFHHRDLQLILTGATKRNGQECAVVDYRALFNTVQITNASMSLTGRSNYWGQVMVSKAGGRIEYATLYEDVLGEVTVPGQPKPIVVNVFRIGAFEPLEK